MSKLITPKNDIAFKRIFGTKGNEEILKDFLEYVLERKLKSVKLDLATELLPDFYEGKNSRVDVRSELDDGTQINVEMQTDRSKYSEKRCLQYWSKIYSNTIEKSEDYEKMQKTICIWIIDSTVYDDIKEFKSQWKIRETKTGMSGHFEEFEIYVIELKKFRENAIMKQSKKDFWLWFIDYTNMEMVNMACISNERIKEAREQLDKITSDKQLMNIIISQEMHERDEIMAKNVARRQGLEEGRAEGEAKGLAIGEKRKQLEIAKKMKGKGMDIITISEVTGLSEEEVKNI